MLQEVPTQVLRPQGGLPATFGPTAVSGIDKDERSNKFSQLSGFLVYLQGRLPSLQKTSILIYSNGLKRAYQNRISKNPRNERVGKDTYQSQSYILPLARDPLHCIRK